MKPEKPPPVKNKATAGKPGFTTLGEPTSPGSAEALRANQAREQAKVDAGNKAKELQKTQQARIEAAAQKKAQELEEKAQSDAEKARAYRAKLDAAAQAKAEKAATDAQNNLARYEAKMAASKGANPVVIKGAK